MRHLLFWGHLLTLLPFSVSFFQFLFLASDKRKKGDHILVLINAGVLFAFLSFFLNSYFDLIFPDGGAGIIINGISFTAAFLGWTTVIRILYTVDRISRRANTLFTGAGGIIVLACFVYLEFFPPGMSFWGFVFLYAIVLSPWIIIMTLLFLFRKTVCQLFLSVKSLIFGGAVLFLVCVDQVLGWGVLTPFLIWFWHISLIRNLVLRQQISKNKIQRFCRVFSLTEREQEVLHLLNQGYGNQQIGDELCISLSTVKKHVSAILDKTESSGRFEVIQRLQQL